MLGAIADDITGAVDLASNLVSRGFRTRLRFGLGGGPLEYADADAIVVALKSRTAPIYDAVRDSQRALNLLRHAGADRIYVKYCSTFDSTPRGNIGPVCDAVMEQMAARTAVVVPSFPGNGRTVYRGHLFVGDVLLSESSLAHHPLTPMTDPNIVRVLQHQTDAAVALIPLETVRQGADAVRRALAELETRGVRYAVVDAVVPEDLDVIADAVSTATVVTGGSGLALGMAGTSAQPAAPTPTGARDGAGVVLAGSASAATRTQLAHFARSGRALLRLDVDDLDAAVAGTLAAADELLDQKSDATIAIAPAESDRPIDATTATGAARATALEVAFGQLARGFVDRGIRRFIVAGGETSGAVVEALHADDLTLGNTISPGVAWTFASVTTPTGPTPVALALKSGNFGPEDIFLDAWRHLT